MLKRVLCGVIISFMVLQMAIGVGAVEPDTVYAQKFIDVPPTHWAYQYISEMTECGILSGYNEYEFVPEGSITRAEFATIMCRAAQLDTPYVNTASYVDVRTDDWYAPYIESAKYYLSGYISDGKKYYKPNEKAVREDIAVALVKLKGYSTEGYNEEVLKSKFADWQSISQDARKYIYSAINNNLISGYEDNTFRGQGTLTRAEAATLFYRAFQLGNDNKIFEKEVFEKETFDEIPPAKASEKKSTTEQSSQANENVNKNINIKLTANQDSFTVEEGETVEITVTANYSLSDIHLAGYDASIEGDTDFLKSTVPDIKQETKKTEFSWTTKKLNAGVYYLNCKVGNASERITITVEEPEPEYTYEVTTISNKPENIGNIIATNDGVYIISVINGMHQIVYFLSKDGEKETVLDSDELEQISDAELSKAEKANMHHYIRGLGINPSNNHAYTIAEETGPNGNYYLYDLSNAKVVRELNTKEKDQIGVGHGMDGFHIKTGTRFYFDEFENLFVPWDDYLYLYDYDSFEFVKNGNIDYYIKNLDQVFNANTNYCYALDKEFNFYRIALNGDETLLFGEKDIKISDRKKLDRNHFTKRGEDIIPSHRHTTAVSDDEDFYFYDYTYDCIRIITKMK